MFTQTLGRLFGSKNDRTIRKLRAQVSKINELEPSMQALADGELQALIHKLRERHGAGASLDALLPEAFAAVREAGVRALGMRHYDVQLIGGMVLNSGDIAEMRTGEGKTLVATLPAYLQAVAGNGVHIVTVNDYLARRDCQWMGKLYHALGLSTGVVVPQQDLAEKKQSYQADITYGTNNEFGFDYLRDNMVFAHADKVQRGHHFAIVDEVDSILIDEARTPLIISGPASDNSEYYRKINAIIPKLRGRNAIDEVDEEVEDDSDFVVNEKDRQVELTDHGHERVEQLLAQAGLIEADAGLYDNRSLRLLHYVQAGLKAYHLFKRNVQYLVRDGKVVIIDEHTGRALPGRRWSEGIHQAVEAKESVAIQLESQTLASTTFQNYFRIYDNLAGMTGTADTEAYEFQQIYGLDVVVVPTHQPMVRDDANDKIYANTQDKFQALISDIEECQQRSQPVLVGTASVENSEALAAELNKRKIKHNVLNANQNAHEAQVIAEAGVPGAVTIATNMAGRGTDIVLGGNLELQLEQLEDAEPAQAEQLRQDWQRRHDSVIAAGGLRVIGSERHESRRIDNQLRGRSGRQGDPGSTCFYLSLEDDLMRIFASDKMRGLMEKLGLKDGEVIEHRMVNNAIERAQRKVEQRNFDIRKQLLEYDDIANEQRQAIYKQRDELLELDDLQSSVHNMLNESLERVVARHIDDNIPKDQWDLTALQQHLQSFRLSLPESWQEQSSSTASITQQLQEEGLATLERKEQLVGAETMRKLEKQLTLQILDATWKQHLQQMDWLRQGVHLRGYAQKNPKQEYKREAWEMFSELITRIADETVRVLLTVEIRTREEVEKIEQQRAAEAARLQQRAAQQKATQQRTSAQPQHRTPQGGKIGRNAPCFCGSGKKYKHCHGR